MKYQKIVLEYWKLLYVTICYLLLALSGWVLIRLIIACFKYPQLMKNLQKQQQLMRDDTDVTSEEYIAEKKRS